uniref:Uncharacterized protein n=1 Tax=Myotis myotis TaxID=51298 RepID=A0A7J7Z4L3_MYOMY|nr:hypothetical protein mMyoMyo1_010394 [Myotis myotis]
MCLPWTPWCPSKHTPSLPLTNLPKPCTAVQETKSARTPNLFSLHPKGSLGRVPIALPSGGYSSSPPLRAPVGASAEHQQSSFCCHTPVGSSLNQATSTCRSMGHRCETRERGWCMMAAFQSITNWVT